MITLSFSPAVPGKRSEPWPGVPGQNTSTSEQKNTIILTLGQEILTKISEKNIYFQLKKKVAIHPV